jgi:hypothetical protein
VSGRAVGRQPDATESLVYPDTSKSVPCSSAPEPRDRPSIHPQVRQRQFDRREQLGVDRLPSLVRGHDQPTTGLESQDFERPGLVVLTARGGGGDAVVPHVQSAMSVRGRWQNWPAAATGSPAGLSPSGACANRPSPHPPRRLRAENAPRRQDAKVVVEGLLLAGGELLVVELRATCRSLRLLARARFGCCSFHVRSDPGHCNGHSISASNDSRPNNVSP